MLTRVVGPLLGGAVLGVALAAALGYLWLCFGADPTKDPLLSF